MFLIFFFFFFQGKQEGAGRMFSDRTCQLKYFTFGQFFSK